MEEEGWLGRMLWEARCGAPRSAGLTCGAEGLTRCGEALERLASHTDCLGLVWAEDGRGWAPGWAEVGCSPRLPASQGHLVLPPPQPDAPCFVNVRAGASRSGSRTPRTQGPALLLSEQVGAGPDLLSIPRPCTCMQGPLLTDQQHRPVHNSQMQILSSPTWSSVASGVDSPTCPLTGSAILDMMLKTGKHEQHVSPGAEDPRWQG